MLSEDSLRSHSINKRDSLPPSLSLPRLSLFLSLAHNPFYLPTPVSHSPFSSTYVHKRTNRCARAYIDAHACTRIQVYLGRIRYYGSAKHPRRKARGSNRSLIKPHPRGQGPYTGRLSRKALRTRSFRSSRRVLLGYRISERSASIETILDVYVRKLFLFA